MLWKRMRRVAFLSSALVCEGGETSLNGTDAFLQVAKEYYAKAANAAGNVLQRAGILNDQPPPREHRLRHWAFSLGRVHDSLAIAALDVPWWTYDAIDAVSDWLLA